VALSAARIFHIAVQRPLFAKRWGKRRKIRSITVQIIETLSAFGYLYSRARRSNANALIPPRFDPESGENVSVQRGKMRNLYAGAKSAGTAARAHAASRDLALAGGLLRLIRP
jgi:hypothetical protein